MAHLIRLGLPDFVDVAPGAALVAVPPLAGQCFVRRHSRCDYAARVRRLTCWNHRALEGFARRLAAAEAGALRVVRRETHLAYFPRQLALCFGEAT